MVHIPWNLSRVEISVEWFPLAMDDHLRSLFDQCRQSSGDNNVADIEQLVTEIQKGTVPEAISNYMEKELQLLKSMDATGTLQKDEYDLVVKSALLHCDAGAAGDGGFEEDSFDEEEEYGEILREVEYPSSLESDVSSVANEDEEEKYASDCSTTTFNIEKPAESTTDTVRISIGSQTHTNMVPESNYTALNDKIARLEDDISQKQIQIIQLKTKYSNAKNQARVYKDDNDDHNQHIKELETKLLQLNQSNADLHSQITTLSATSTAHTTLILEKDSELSDLRREFTELEESFVQKCDKYNRQTKEFSDFKIDHRNFERITAAKISSLEEARVRDEAMIRVLYQCLPRGKKHLFTNSQRQVLRECGYEFRGLKDLCES